MITTKDRMGGFISAHIVNVKEIESFQVKNNQVQLTYKDSYIPSYLDSVKNGIEAQVTSTSSKSGKLFNIDISIEVKNMENLNYTSFNRYLTILKTTTNEFFVFGTLEFPLTLLSNPKFGKSPSDRASRFINLTGKQPHDVLIV